MDKVVGTVGKNALEQLQIAVKEYQGYTYVGIRLFFLGDDDTWRSTKKGVTVSPALWPEFKQALSQVDAHLPPDGSTPPRRPSPRGGTKR